MKSSVRRESAVEVLEARIAPAFVSTTVSLADLAGANGSTLQGANAGDLSGSTVSAAGDVNGDGFGDFLIGSEGAGTAAVIFGTATGFPANVTLDASFLDGDQGFRIDVGRAVSAAGDVNGDGFDDVIVGSRLTGAAGAAFVIFGKADGFAAQVAVFDLDGTSGFRIIGGTAGDAAGTSVSGAGDVNGDGFDDVLVGAPGVAGGKGAAFLIYGKASGFAAGLVLSGLTDEGVQLNGVSANDGAGTAVSGAGDVNGDGLADLIVGAPRAEGGTKGAAYVVFGGATLSATIGLDTLTGGTGFKLNGVANNDATGGAVSGAGDVNGDGFADVIVGASKSQGGNNRGAAHVVFGKAGAFSNVITLDTLNGVNGFSVFGPFTEDFAGASVSGAGDVNGDGIDDLLIGAPQNGTTVPDAGDTYLLFGRTGIFTAPNLGAPDVTNLIRFRGVASEVGAGTAVSGAGDVNGDGFADLLISNPTASSNKGASYLVLGGPSGFLIAPTITGGTAIFTDLDGDLVTVKVSKGTLTAANFQLLEKTPGSGRAQLLTLTLPDDANDTFHGADVSITAKRAGGGDGRVNVGFINGTGVDLGAVKIAGDLGRIAAGDAVNDLALKSLTVGTLGFFGGRTGDTGTGLASVISGAAGPLKVTGDVRASLVVGRTPGATDGGDLASLTIGGSVIGGDTDASGAIAALDRMGPVKITGDLRGGAGDSSGIISAAGTLGNVTIGGSMIGGGGQGSGGLGGQGAVGAVSIGGSLIAGSGDNSAAILAGNLGKVTIKGDQISGDGFSGAILSAYGTGNIVSVTIGGDARSRTGDRSAVGILANGSLGPVVIKGDVVGTAEAPYTIAAGAAGVGQTLAISSLKVGGDFAHALVLGGYSIFNSTVNGRAQIGAISVGGDWIASSVTAGLLPHAGATNATGSFGNGDDAFITTGPTSGVASIASVTIKGAARGTLEIGDRYAIVAEQIGSVSVSGVKLPLTKSPTADPANNLAAIPVGPTPDFVVREVSRVTPAPAPTSPALTVVNPVLPAAFALSSLDGTNGFKLTGVANSDKSGSAVSGAGDVNGDGFADLIIGATYADDGGPNRGASYVVFGRAGGFSSALALADLDGSNGFKIRGLADLDRAGQSVSGAGDVNGDGFADLIVGALFANEGGTSRGASYVIFGKASGFSSELALSALDGSNGFKLSGVTNNDQSGFAVSGAGDVNGDGFADLIVGARYADEAGSNRGATYVVFGKAGGFNPALALSTLDGSNGFKLSGVTDNDQSGFAVSGAGDVNGDGFADLVIGAPGADEGNTDRGASYVVFGKDGGFGPTLALSSLDGSNGFRLSGVADSDESGRFVSAAGDVNGDGFADLIVSTAFTDDGGPNRGASYVVFGKAGGFSSALALSALDGSNGFKLNGAADNDFSGIAISGAGDVNGDGFADLIVGAIYADEGGTDRGASYVVFGKAGGFSSALALSVLDGSNGFKLSGVADNDRSGGAVSGAGDVNGDGFADLIIGAPGADEGDTDRGASYVVFGGPSGELGAPAFSADGKTATWTDVDGDLVTLKVSRGTLDINNIFLAAKSATDSRSQLLRLSLTGEFENADVSLTAKRAGGGDGRVNVGSIETTGIDLGKVTVSGDLGRILAGDTTADPGLKSLTVGSLGLFGGRTGFAGAGVTSNVSGAVGSLKVAGDLVGAYFLVQHADGVSGGDLGTVSIGGSLIGGKTSASGLIETGGRLGAVKVGGDLVGGAGFYSGSLYSGRSFGSVTIGGSMIGGTGVSSGSVESAGDFGSVSVRGSLIGGGGSFSAAIYSSGKLGSVSIGGSQLGGGGFESGAIDSAGNMGMIRIGGDQVGGSGNSSAIIYTRATAADIAGVTIGGDARMGTERFSGGVFAGGKLGPVVITGDVIGTASKPYIIQGQGALTGAQSVAITSVKIGGDFQRALIRAGFDQIDNPTNGHAQIGAISVGGDWIASSVTAGLNSFLGAPDPSVTFGNGDDVFNNGGPTGVIASIAGITIKGRAMGSLEAGDRYGIVAESIGSVKIGGVKLALTAGTDAAGFSVGSTPDFIVREVARV